MSSDASSSDSPRPPSHVRRAAVEPALYILDGRETVRVDRQRWEEWMASHLCRLRHDRVGETVVSTIFLGVDHNLRGSGPPLLFETTVLKHGDVPQSEGGRRSSTWIEAIALHELALTRLRNATR